MATTISNVFQTMFAAEVHQAYQGTSVLQGTCRTRTNVGSEIVKFPKLAATTASERTPGTLVTAANAQFSNVSCTLKNWSAHEYTDIFNQAKVNFDERNEVAQSLGNAIGRRMDQVILDALLAASAGSTVANTVVTTGSATASDMNVGKILEAGAKLSAKNVPMTDRHLIMHANSMKSLLGDERAVSSDFIQLQGLARGEVSTFAGFSIHMIGDRDEDGLTIDGSSDRTCFAFHKDAIGHAIGMAPKTEINYQADRTSWLVSAMFSSNAVAIDVNGICDITCRES
jgi:hypothetical protein